MNGTDQKWYSKQPWKTIAFIILLVISPATFGFSLLLLFGLYNRELNTPLQFHGKVNKA